MDLSKSPREVFMGNPVTPLHQPAPADAAQILEEIVAGVDGLGSEVEDLGTGVGDLQGRTSALEAEVSENMLRVATTAEGIAATEEGGKFRLISSDPGVSSYIYRHDPGGVATLIETVPSAAALVDRAPQAQVDALETDLTGLLPRAAILVEVPGYSGPLAMRSANGAVVLTFDTEGRAVLRIAPGTRDRLFAEAAAAGLLPSADLLAAFGSVAGDLAQAEELALPAIRSGRALLLSFDPATGEARFRVSQDVAEQVLARLGGTIAPVPYDPVAEGLLPSPEIAMFGDSMSPEQVRSALADKLDRPVYRYAVGGLRARAIGELQGGLPLPVRVVGGVVPGDGSEVDLVPFNDCISPFDGRPAFNPYNNQTSATRSGTVLGVPVVLRRYGDPGNPATLLKWTLRLAAAGDELAVPDDSVFVFDDALANRNRIPIIQAGRNDWDSLTDRQQIVWVREYVEAMVDYLAPLDKRFLILSVHTGTGQGTGTSGHSRITALNAELAETFGDRFCDQRGYMVKHAIQDALDQGLIGEITSDDLADMASDTIPRGLISPDMVHMNSVGWEMFSQYQARQIKARGW